MRGVIMAGALGLTLAAALACGGGGYEAAPATDLAFTQWQMEFTVGEDEYYTIDFIGDGTYMVDGESLGTWGVSGDVVSMAEDGYTFDGTLVDSFTIGGTVTQLEDGDTWPFRMSRMR
jgi:hypothetical protein